MEALKRKIQKLMALSQSPNENEAMAAAAKARKLLEENNLSEADIRDIKLDKVVQEHITKGRIEPWMRELIGATARYYMCAAVVSGSVKTGSLCFVGRPGNVATAKEMYGYFLTVCVLESVKSGFKTKKQQDDFKAGVAQGIGMKLKELQAQREREMSSQVRDLVVTEDSLVKNWLQQNTTRARYNAPRYNQEAYAAGHEAGKRVNINPQVRG